MNIPRLHLFELEDQPWFPFTIRDLCTDYLHFIEKQFALHRPAVPLVAEALRLGNTTSIIDLCSGGGGPILPLLDALVEQGVAANAILTDRYPNRPAFQQNGGASQGRISFRLEPVDARAVPSELRGLRTLFNSFHHFRPADAIAVLRDAARARQPIGIFEIPERRVRNLVSMILLTPLMVAVATPFMRPFRWRRLLWTYVAPLVPLTVWWDGIVSQSRAYSPAELERLARAVGVEGYSWRAGRVPIGPMPGFLTYLIGYPESR
jgi:hypothetical protein